MAEINIQTQADTRIYISENPVSPNPDAEASDYAGISWIEVEGAMNIGDLGGEQATNSYEPIKGNWVLKSKGSRDGGTMTNVFIPIHLDPGQTKLREAVEDKCNPYAFKVERGASCSPESTVTISIADPGVVTWTGSNFSAGQPVVFSDEDGTLPTGILPDVAYYVVAAGLTADTFSVSATVGGAPIETTGTTSGTIIATAPPAGMTQLFQALVTDGVRSGGARNDQYTLTYNLAVTGRIITV